MKSLDLNELYNSLFYHFNNNDYPNWESEYIKVLNYLGYYDESIKQSYLDFKKYLDKKNASIKKVHLDMEEKIPNIFEGYDENINDIIYRYFQIFKNKDNFYKDNGVDLKQSQSYFFKDLIEYLNYQRAEFPYNEKIKNDLMIFSSINKDIGDINNNSNYYVIELKNKYNSEFDFQNNLNCPINFLETFKNRLKKPLEWSDL
ncbi:hypothetical protein [Faecalibacter rhinopitheci]|uniref:Uncharacterized protein n=1 Tax=Faecalibacter rhinopitheci TaxID=2779678 RepID=A0A8J7K9X8_9FLAO|nr:hypothetical protein [Faecalibacter rhinopitheci]MBF0596800.1 hypothetical protein [Faecalibacter rhinopitheci]